MNEIVPFVFDDDGRVWPVRTVWKDDAWWFVAADLCRVLGVKNVAQAVERLDEDEKGICISDTLGGQQEVLVVSRSGMYALVLWSRKPRAKKFRKWVTAEVLPSLERTGRYAMPGLSGAPPIGDYDRGMVEALLHQHQLRILAAVRAVAGPDVAGVREALVKKETLSAITGLSWENVRRTAALLMLLGLVQGDVDQFVPGLKALLPDKTP